MNITLKTREFQRALELAGSVVERKSTIPILSNVLIVADGDVVTVTGTDLEVGIMARMEAVVCEDGRICLPAKELKDLIKGAGKWGETVSLTVQGTSALIEYPTAAGSATMRLPGLDAESYPEVPTPSKVYASELEDKDKLAPDGDKLIPIGTFTGAALCRLIDRTAYAISQEESRFTLNGALLLYRAGKARMVSTDGHRMALADEEFSRNLEDKGQVMVRKLALVACKRIWGKLPDSRITVSGDENHLFFASPSVLLTTRRLSGNFPDYQRVLPKDLPNTVSFDRLTMLDTLKRSLKVADERSHAVRLVLNGAVKVECSSVDRGEFAEVVTAQWDGPEDTVAAYNGEYLIDWLSSITAPTAALAVKPVNTTKPLDEEYEGPERKPEWAVRDAGLGSVGDAHALHVIMPMRM